MLVSKMETDRMVDAFLSTPIGERQLSILCQCIDEDNSEQLNILVDVLRKRASKPEMWEMHPGVFLRKLNEHRLSASGNDEALFRCCLVRVLGVEPNFSYLTDDLTLLSGERVLVPFGRENRVQIAEITRITDCTAGNAPFPVEKMKTIIGRTDKTTESQ